MTTMAPPENGVDLLGELIRDGELDHYLKKIARWCVERDKKIKEGAVKGGPFQGRIVVWREDDDEAVPAEQESAPAPASRSTARKPLRRRSFDQTFRWVDGKLYAKKDVRGKIINHDGQWYKVAGSGDKSFLMKLCDSTGHLLPEKPIWWSVSSAPVARLMHGVKPVEER